MRFYPWTYLSTQEISVASEEAIDKFTIECCLFVGRVNEFAGGGGLSAENRFHKINAINYQVVLDT